MNRSVLLASAALVLGSTAVLAQRAPESILPPGVGTPSPTPAPTPAPAATQAPAPAQPSGGEVVQPLPSAPERVDTSEVDLSDIPSVKELEEMTTDELDEFLGLKPRYDIPPAARRSTERVGIIDRSEGGLPVASLARQPAAIVRAALVNTDQPLVSRWGHIVLRRALASRLEAPAGMDPVDFAALRAATLNAMGEHAVARALVQDVDTSDYNGGLTDAALAAHIGTSDILGVCPVVRLEGSDRSDLQWSMLAAICAAYAGETTTATNDLRRLLSRSEESDQIDVLLAQRYAGAAGEGRRAVTIEWDGIEEMNPWRFALANALGEPIPENLSEGLGAYYLNASAINPALPVAERLRGARVAGEAGILSSKAMVDLYSQLYAAREEAVEADAGIALATSLRNAYVDPAPANRLAAIREIWDREDGYGGMVLTAYAAARLTPSDDFADDAGQLIASMLTAGLERDALRWADVVDDGSLGWALLALANPQDVQVSDGQLSSFTSDDESANQRKSRMLLAGLAGLGRIDSGTIAEHSDSLSVSLDAPTAWTQMIDKSAEADNAALVVMLAGLGMQGDSWDQMTARHLYHIVSALNRVGLEAEARMIAAEAVARA